MPVYNYFDPLSLQEIASFFKQNGQSNVKFNAYYRGGQIVADVPLNSLIPTNGPIAISNFYARAQGRVAIYLVINGTTYNYDVYAQRTSAYIPGYSDIYVVVQPGVFVGSNIQYGNTNSPAISVPATFNAGDTVSIINSGYVYGCGGNGGGGTSLPGNPGNQGGTALKIARPTTVANYGELSGGGGGGGGGAIYIPNKGGTTDGAGGGGGAGLSPGVVGYSRVSPAANGSPGSLNTGGAGGSGELAYSGAGGARGASGTVGGGISGANPGPGGNGGVGGYAVEGLPYITWIAEGTRTGPVT